MTSWVALMVPATPSAVARVCSSVWAALGRVENATVSLVGRLLCADTLVHTWDLAGATGQDERLDPDGVARAIEFLTPIDEAMRGPRGFAPKITPPAGADEQTKLLNFCGRAP